ncbi:MAG: hypothetical protein D6725_07820 [Planctomycetota bacterium]|nr:MAG: hypothetical protein D6725_07820 [Planctomycetota bacterium]
MTRPVSPPPDIQRRLKQLRRRIRAYVLVEGTALVLATLGLLFWLSFLLDVAYFHWRRVELPHWFRVAFDVFVLGLVAALLLTWVVARTFRRFRERALALVLERRFPELNDRLITAVEASQSLTGRETPLTLTMLEHTIQEAARLVRSLDLSLVFEKRPLRRAVVSAAVLAVSIAALAVLNQQALARWKAGFVDLQPQYWEREYGLVVRVLMQPGDVVREFEPAGTELSIKHARSGDLVLLIESEPGKRTPARVQIEYQLLDSGGGGVATCTRSSDGSFRYTFSGLLEDVRFWVIGGDFRNRYPYVVRVVDAPRADRIILACRYPDYTGLAGRSSDEVVGALPPEFDGRDNVLLAATQQSLPMETDFLLHVQANKPLRRVSMQFGRFELDFEAVRGTPQLAATRAAFKTAAADVLPRPTAGGVLGSVQWTSTSAAGDSAESADASGADARSDDRPVAGSDAERAGTTTSGGPSPPKPPAPSASALEAGGTESGSEGRSTISPPVGRAGAAPASVHDSSNDAGAAETAFWGTLTERNAAGEIVRQVRLGPQRTRPFLSAEAATTFTVPFLITAQTEQQVAKRLAAYETPWGTPLILPPDVRVRITLEDEDGLLSLDPERFTVNGVVDQPPTIETRLRGIGSSITRKARIPVTGWIRDDYGIVDAGFVYEIGGRAEPETATFEHPVTGYPREFRLGGEADRAGEERTPPAERFDVLPLELSVGDKLTLFVRAVDGDDINGPHQSDGERYTFQVVTNEELLSLLYRRELNQRQIFERVIEELEQTRQDLILHRARLAERDDGAGEGQSRIAPRTRAAFVAAVAQPDASVKNSPAPSTSGIGDLDTAVEACAQRSLLAIRKNRTETLAVEQAFRDIREEMVNNRVDTPKLLERIDDRILAPLQRINEADFLELDRALGQLALYAQRRQVGTDDFDGVIDSTDALIAGLKAILGEMRKLESFQEAVELLKAIIKQEEELLEKTKQEKKKRDLEKLRGSGLLD